jgi:hypothetical protein
MTAFVYHPQQQTNVIVSSRPSSKTVLCFVHGNFWLQAFSLLEKSLKKAADLEIMSVHWLQIAADDPTTDGCESLAKLQPWKQYSNARMVGV